MVRLNKFLAERLGVSRREADDLIAGGKVKINGETAEIGARVDKFDEVWYNGGIVSQETRYSYVMLNKPRGYVCSRRRQGETPTIYELLPEEMQGLKTVGRLDKDSSGLLILTNDGDFAFKMTHPKFKKEKEYRVRLDRALSMADERRITTTGVEIGDGPSKLGLEALDKTRKYFKVTMSEGRNRQIRRTFAGLGYGVMELHRVRLGLYVLGGLVSGLYQEVPKL